MPLTPTLPVSNAERQREFRARNPGYRNRFRYRHKTSPVMPAEVTSPAVTEVAEPTLARPEPTLFDPFPPFELKVEEKPIDLYLAGQAM